MSTWRLARALETLRDEVNAANPDRPKGSDGTIGDERHQAEKSDHNPNSPHPGVVTAWDITTAPFTDALAERLRTMGAAGDLRIKYVIYKGRITTRDLKGWKKYTGYSGHFDHIHLSVSNDPKFYDSTAPWHPFTQEDEMTDKDWKRLDKMLDDKISAAVASLHHDIVIMLHGDPTDGHVNSLDSIGKQVGVPQT